MSYSKFYKIRKTVSYDCGETFEDYINEEGQYVDWKGDLYERGLTYCGDEPRCTIEITHVDGSVTTDEFEDCMIPNWKYRWDRTIKSVVINQGITSIGKAAFEGCSNLESVIIPNSVEFLHEAVFAMTNISHIELPSSISMININEFALCSNLVSIRIPSSVTNIMNTAFNQCPNLSDIYYDGTLEQWDLVEKSMDWVDVAWTFKVHCSDGDLYYDELDWVASDGNGYFETDYVANPNTKVQCYFTIQNPYVSSWFFGGYDSRNNVGLGFGTQTSTNKFMLSTQGTRKYAANVSHTTSMMHTEISPTEWRMNDLSRAVATYSKSTLTQTVPFYILGCRRYETSGLGEVSVDTASTKLHSITIGEDGGGTIYNFKPLLRNDLKVVLYDSIHRIFLLPKVDGFTYALK